jgi:tetratricopeptide (TPR) repeat protein
VYTAIARIDAGELEVEAGLALALEHFDETFAVARRGLFRNLTSPLRLLKARLFALQGMEREARGEFDQAILETPQAPQAYNSRGEYLFCVGDYEGAERDFAEFVRLTPGRGAEIAARVTAWIELKQYLNAAIELTKLLQIHQACKIWMLRGEAFYVLDRFEQAANDFDRAAASTVDEREQAVLWREKMLVQATSTSQA